MLQCVVFKKYFTPKEANQTLHIVKKIVTEILEKGRSLRALLSGQIGDVPAPQTQTLAKEVEGLMLQLEEIGCFYKDWNFETGLVDFPAMIDGEEALLCWRSDEGEILWYHSLEDGFAGRRPLPAEPSSRLLFRNK